MIQRLVPAAGLTKQLANRVVQAVEWKLNLKQPLEISVVVVGDVRMKRLNQQYRQQPKITDVLSFPYGGTTGEVVICYPQAKRQANAKQQPLKNELAWLLIHGILHVLGYDHETAKDAQVMRPLEQQLLTKLGYV